MIVCHAVVAQILADGPAAKGGDARKEDVEALADRVQGVVALFGRGDARVGQGDLEGQQLDLGLGQRPLRGVAVGGGQLVDLAARIGAVDPDRHGNRAHRGQKATQQNVELKSHRPDHLKGARLKTRCAKDHTAVGTGQ